MSETEQFWKDFGRWIENYSPPHPFGEGLQNCGVASGLGNYLNASFVCPQTQPVNRYRYSRYASRVFRTDLPHNFRKA